MLIKSTLDLKYVFFPQKIYKIVRRYGTGDYVDPIKYLIAIGTKTDIEVEVGYGHTDCGVFEWGIQN